MAGFLRRPVFLYFICLFKLPAAKDFLFQMGKKLSAGSFL
ncbi:hypothetical protein CL3_31230 [butyrate-producing bacterium SM4/1]|nr:hypothetical protein CLS_14170 [[Clostridium] cf. saccharolyticum K10]CBL36933.1 hypothetical protein CL3_31230 [butyrate-producing bacterium SM4/1]